MTEQGILEAKARFQKLAEKEQNMAKITGLKNELEATLYSSREKLESDVIVSVSTEEQREAVLKLCTDSEEWMYEASDDLHEYEKKLGDIQNVLGPIEERAAEAEARLDLPGSVKEMVQEIKSIQQQVVKNMSWVNESKTADAAAKLTEFEEWWVKKQEQQAALPSHEAPAYTKAAVMEKLDAVHKEWDKLKKIKKPKAPKVAKAPKSKDGAALPVTVEATQTELAAVREKKVAAVEKEDFDAAHKLKNREKTLVDHLAKLQTDKPEKSEL